VRTWWEETAAVLDAYAQTEQHSLLTIRGAAAAEVAAMNRVVVLNALMGLLVTTVITLLVAFTIRRITSSVTEISAAARKIADGEIDIRVQSGSGDEIGALADSFNKMVTGIQQHAETARLIGTGDYRKEVNVRSERDVLG